jgi:hypothetical protein
MITKVKLWLENPKRDYAEGLGFFEQYASPEIKKKYLHFLQLKEGEEKVKAFDMHFSVLINKVNAIYGNMKFNPGKYSLSDVKKPEPEPSIREEIFEKSRKIKELEDDKEALLLNIEELEALDEENQEEIGSLNADIEDKDAEIESLQSELEETLKQNGLKIVKYENLPAEVKKKYDRTKEIVPLIATLHTEIGLESISDNERKKLVDELCRLDDERRKLWDDIDAWSHGKDVVLEETKETEYSEDPLVKGMQVSKRMERLKENIKRSHDAIDKHLKAGKKNLTEKAGKRLAAFEKELSDLESLTE